MTVLSAARVALGSLIATELPTVRVQAFPCGEDTPLEECVHLGDCESEFEWRCIGSTARNRFEDVSIQVVVHAYRTAPDQRDAASAALLRCEELLASVETAIVEDPAGPFTLGGVLTNGKVTSWTVRSVPREKGWTAQATARVTGRSYP